MGKFATGPKRSKMPKMKILVGNTDFIKIASKNKYLLKMSTESVQKLGESIERFNMDSRAGHCDGFQAPFFPINPFPDLGYEEPFRGLLLWPVIHSM